MAEKMLEKVAAGERSLMELEEKVRQKCNRTSAGKIDCVVRLHGVQNLHHLQ